MASPFKCTGLHGYRSAVGPGDCNTVYINEHIDDRSSELIVLLRHLRELQNVQVVLSGHKEYSQKLADLSNLVDTNFVVRLRESLKATTSLYRTVVDRSSTIIDHIAARSEAKGLFIPKFSHEAFKSLISALKDSISAYDTHLLQFTCLSQSTYYFEDPKLQQFADALEKCKQFNMTVLRFQSVFSNVMLH